MAAAHEVPGEIDADYIARLSMCSVIARGFKVLICQLATEDLNTNLDFNKHLKESSHTELDEQGRLINEVTLAHGHYVVLPSTKPEIDPVRTLNAGIYLSKPEGGREYRLGMASMFGSLAAVSYFEDMPPGPREAKGADDLRLRFKIEREAAVWDLGVSHLELTELGELTTNIEAVRLEDRLQLNHDDCYCERY